MLVITRRKDEQIVLELPNGKEIRVIVVQSTNNHVRLGLIAPRDINIQRYDEEQKATKELLAFKKLKKIKCDDNDYVNFWLDAEIPQFGLSAREVLRKEPLRYSEVIEVLRKELDASSKF